MVAVVTPVIATAALVPVVVAVANTRYVGSLILLVVLLFGIFVLFCIMRASRRSRATAESTRKTMSPETKMAFLTRSLGLQSSTRNSLQSVIQLVRLDDSST